MTATLPDRWYYRLTQNQEDQINKYLGECKGLHFQNAIAKLEAAGRSDLAKVVHEAAVKAGCTGEPPLVDDRLAERMRAERFGNRPHFNGPTHANGFYKGPPRPPVGHASAPRGPMVNHSPHLEMDLPLADH